MQVGNLVKPKPDWAVAPPASYGYGIILDVYEDEDGTTYCEVCWWHQTQWWKPHELELVSGNR